MGALVIDVGQLYAERAQLQNGADAGAMAVAKSCAAGPCAPATAVAYADANAADGVSAVRLVCGSGGLGACPASTGEITDCPAPPGGRRTTSTCTPPPRTPAARRCCRRPSPGRCWATAATTAPPCSPARRRSGVRRRPRPRMRGHDLGLRVGRRRPAREPCSRRRRPTRRIRAPPPSADRVLKLAHQRRAAAAPASRPVRTDPARSAGPRTIPGRCSVAIISATYGDSTQASAGQSCLPALATAVASRAPVDLAGLRLSQRQRGSAPTP